MTETLEQRIQSLEKLLAAQPRSPLFAQLASFYLEAGRSQDALTVCDAGLAHYPFYSTGHLVKGKTLLALNMRSEARREFELVHQMLPLNDAVGRLLADIPPSSDETLEIPQPPAAPEAESAPSVSEEPTVSPESPAAAEPTPEDLLSQFTEEASRPAVESPPPEELPSQAEEATGTQEDASAGETAEEIFGIAEPAPLTQQEETFGPSEESPGPPVATTEQSEAIAAFEAFAERKRGELFGLENSVSLEEYLNPEAQEAPAEPATESAGTESGPLEPDVTVAAEEDPFAALAGSPPTEQTGPSADEGASEDPFAQLTQYEESGGKPAGEPPKDQIEEIAEKLKEAKRITPVINLSERTPTPPSESDTPSGTGFVTPTLAEIYAKQGWYDDAIKAYKALAASKPADREKYEGRIRELEEAKRKSEQGG